MTTYLLDSSTLIALMVEGHEHWARANGWAAQVSEFAVCPVVEGALVRFLVRSGMTGRQTGRVLDRLAERPGYHFWPDDVSYRKVDLGAVLGHRQVTDTYLVSLAKSRDGCVLVTLDRGLALAHPDGALLIPAVS
ncbi:MAG: PIN domain-containing protein [Bifidobacteriaceae bacterium]|jgi:predicted nucleic acid-binding protein|nr:PIN domain-containing protein [Bifidobacteriaceae bacterium]